MADHTIPAPPLPTLIDIGINLTHDSYAADRAAVLARAQAAGVAQLVVTGATCAGSAEALELAAAHPGVLYATAGVHPHHATELDSAALEALARLAHAPAVVAVGECGLDYFRNHSPPAVQRQAFERQLELAQQLGKPVFLHQREAHDDFLALLRTHATHWRGVAHCFTGHLQELEGYLALGLHIGVTGWICDERRGKHLLDVVRAIPRERLLLETDGPYLLPRDLVPRPATRRNEPAYLPHIAATVARARGESLADLAAHSTRAARALFGLQYAESLDAEDNATH
ncbi:MAG: TatD family hydrolase [Gammaproteobacteria bacterium]|nr:TatD family hydrolase [Gammaproteobacteria bacterium]MBV9621007.1 TatD family hydrolase [Gammaproteobacteria bacterium]